MHKMPLIVLKLYRCIFFFGGKMLRDANSCSAEGKFFAALKNSRGIFAEKAYECFFAENFRSRGICHTIFHGIDQLFGDRKQRRVRGNCGNFCFSLEGLGICFFQLLGSRSCGCGKDRYFWFRQKRKYLFTPLLRLFSPQAMFVSFEK